MIEKTSIKKIVQSVLRNNKESLIDRHIMHPEREWLLGVLGGVVLVALVAYASISTYVRYSRVSVSGNDVAKSTTIYRTELIEAAIAEINARSEVYNTLKIKIADTSQTAVLTPVPENIDASIVVADNASSTTVTANDTVTTPPIATSTEDTLIPDDTSLPSATLDI